MVDSLTFSPATEADATELAACLRAADLKEIEALGATRDAVLTGVIHSDWSVCARSSAGVVCILGVTPMAQGLKDVGCLWMLGSNLVHRYRRQILRAAPGYLARMLESYPLLVNHVHAENAKALLWLRSVGAKIDQLQPFGLKGELFHRFEVSKCA